MANTDDPLLEHATYHIYNRTNGWERLFRQEADSHKFLSLMKKYISPVAEISAWALMRNHFHLSVCIKAGLVYKFTRIQFGNEQELWNERKWETVSVRPTSTPANIPPADSASSPSVTPGNDPPVDLANADGSPLQGNRLSSVEHSGNDAPKRPNPSHHISHFCNAYTKYYNEKYKRHGSLFQKPFRRKPIDNDRYLRQLTMYIHCNAIHHGHVQSVDDYPWTSYRYYLNPEANWGAKLKILDVFGGLDNFIKCHKEYGNETGEKGEWWIEG